MSGKNEMRFFSAMVCVAACAAFLSSWPVAAEDLTTNSGKVFKNYRILETSERGMKISHSDGVAYLLYSDVPYEMAGPYSPNLQLRSGRVLKNYSVVKVSYKSLKIAHDSGSVWIPHGDVPRFLLDKYGKEIRAKQEQYWEKTVAEAKGLLSRSGTSAKEFRRIIAKLESISGSFPSALKKEESDALLKRLERAEIAVTPIPSLEALRQLKADDRSGAPQLLVRKGGGGRPYFLLIFPMERKEEVTTRWQQITDIEKNYVLHRETQEEISRLKDAMEKAEDENSRFYRQQRDVDNDRLKKLKEQADQALAQYKQCLDASRAWVIRELVRARKEALDPGQAHVRTVNSDSGKCRLGNVRGPVLLLACEVIDLADDKAVRGWFLEYTPFAAVEWNLEPPGIEQAIKERLTREREKRDRQRQASLEQERQKQREIERNRSSSRMIWVGGGPGTRSDRVCAGCKGSGKQLVWFDGRYVEVKCRSCDGTGDPGSTGEYLTPDGRRHRSLVEQSVGRALGAF